jgi:hypothetical protein
MLVHLVIIGVAGFSGGFIGSQVGAGSVATLPARAAARSACIA